MGSLRELSLETWILLAVFFFALMAGCGPGADPSPPPVVTYEGTMELELESGPARTLPATMTFNGSRLTGVCPDGSGAVTLEGGCWSGVLECPPAAWGFCPEATMSHYTLSARVDQDGRLTVKACGEGSGCGDARLGVLRFNAAPMPKEGERQ